MRGAFFFPLIGSQSGQADAQPLGARPLLPWGFPEQALPLETTTGEVAVTLENATVAAVGAQQFGEIAATLQDATVAAQGFQLYGQIAATLDDATVAATGTAGLAVTGTIAATLDDATVAAEGLALPNLPFTYPNGASSRAELTEGRSRVSILSPLSTQVEILP